MNLCEYSCGREGKYQFKNGKWCCSKNISLCLEIKAKIGKAHKNKNVNKEVREKIRLSQKGKTWLMKYGKEKSEKLRKKRSKYMKGNIPGNKLTISKIKKRYPFFFKIEEIRYNPDKPKAKEIQVHCKNHLCKNSKEQDGWFTPTYIQFYERIRALEKPYGMIENNFYCSKDCKEKCPLYDLRNDLVNNTELPYTYQEKEIWRKKVLEQDNNKCQFCDKEAAEVHHEKPVKTHPYFALDPHNGISSCEECHYKYGHKTGTECSTGSLATKIC
ncbi:MAG: hypothetical protein ACFFG0_01295 [Candidatus Thorarchaeota archaeon]